MRESRTTRAFVCFGQYSEKMVLERAKHSSSTQNLLAQYLRRIHIELSRQEENGFESDHRPECYCLSRHVLAVPSAE